MSLHTPIDKTYRFGELFSIRNSYSNMNEKIEMNRLEERFFNSMISYIVESGNMDKIERFARKNRALCDFTTNNAIKEAYENAEISTCSLNIPKIIKQRASKKAMDAVSKKSLSIKTNSYKLPSFTKPIDEPTIFESLEDYVENDDKKLNIEKLVKDIGNKNSILNGDMEEDSSKENTSNKNTESNIIDLIKHNYSIEKVVIESIAGNDRETELITATTIYDKSQTNEKNFLNSTIKNVTDGINAICGINFTENDYMYMSSVRPLPHLRGESVITSDLVKGNRLLNIYFGPSGIYKDYLYNPDGTPRIEQKKSSSMSDIDKDVNVIQSYPIIKVYATLISWDDVNGKTIMRAISKDDFYGTSIKYID